MLNIRTRSYLVGTFLSAFVAVGIGASIFGGDYLRTKAVETWLDAGEADADRVTEAVLARMAQAEVELRAIALEFKNRKIRSLTDFEALNAEIESWELETSFESIAYAQRILRPERAKFESTVGKPLTVVGRPTETAPTLFESYAVRVSSDSEGYLLPNTDIATHPGTAIVASTAYRTPGKPILGPAFEEQPGHHHILIGIAIELEASQGVFVAIFPLTAFFDALAADIIPAGLQLRLSERDNEARAENVYLPVIGPLEPPRGAVKTFLKRVTMGQARWELNWDLHEIYLGGPKVGIAAALQFGGSIFTLMVAGMIGFLSLRDLRIQHVVEARTRALTDEVAERKRMEEALTESEDRFRDLVVGSIEGIMIHRGFKPLFVNGTYAEIFGFDRSEEVMAKDQFFDLMAPHVAARAKRYAAARMQGQDAPSEYEYEGVKKDGSTIWLDNRVRVISWQGEPAIQSTVVDITERKRAERELEESRERLRAVFENTPVCLNLKDTDGRYILVNKPYEEWLGQPAEEIIGKTASEFLDQTEEVENLTRSELQVLETGQVIESEIRVPRPDGVVYDRILIKFPVKSADGSITAIGTAAIDITDLKRIERELRDARDDLEARVEERTRELTQSEDRFRHAFENAPVGMALITPDGNRFKLNQALADFLGYTVEELTNTTMTSTNADKAKLDESMRLRQRGLDGEIATYRNERTYRHKDGHTIWGEVSGSLFRSESGDPEYFIAHTVDITDLKNREEALQESEANLREVLEKSPMGVSVFTNATDGTRITGDRLFVNEALVEMFGFASAEDMLDADISDSWVDLDQLRAVEEVTARQDELVDFEALRRRVDGTKRLISMHSRPVWFDGQACNMLWHVDITDRMRTEAQLRQSQRWKR